MQLEANFSELEALYNAGDFTKILEYRNGQYFLKLRSMSRPKFLKKLAEEQKIDISTVKPTFPYVFKQNIPINVINEFIRNETDKSLQNIVNEKDKLYTELFQLDVLDWGGLYQNGLERTILNNYVQKIKNYDVLNEKIASELHNSMSGYVKSSWYNHWSTVLIENMFIEHKRILSAIGKVKNLDFFWDDVPLDLKVTYFPKELLNFKRKEKGLDDELTSLKKFAKKNKIHYNNKGNNREIFKELYKKISESSNTNQNKFIVDMKQTNLDIIMESKQDPVPLARWLYEKQSERRFDSAYRFYLILVDSINPEDSWKLKRNRDIVPEKIKSFLSKNWKEEIKDIKFIWKEKEYDTKCFVLFIVKG